MLAFKQGISKRQFMTHINRHAAADAFVSGKYGELNADIFRGCAVGCSLKSVADIKKIELSTSDHKMMQKHLGIPEWLARVEDTLFEGVTPARRKTWPVEFAKAINEGSDLNKIKVPFLIYLMEENLKTLDSLKVDADEFPDVVKAIAGSRKANVDMITAQKSGDKDEIARAAGAAGAAGAARAAEWAAEWAAGAAGAAEWAARAARAAGAARAAEWAARAAGAAAYERHANKLLELIKDCK